MRLSALRFPSLLEGRKLKAHLARRRENAGAWLFEIVDRKYAQRGNIFCVVPAQAGTHTPCR
jgi:hypothetical protein